MLIVLFFLLASPAIASVTYLCMHSHRRSKDRQSHASIELSERGGPSGSRRLARRVNLKSHMQQVVQELLAEAEDMQHGARGLLPEQGLGRKFACNPRELMFGDAQGAVLPLNGFMKVDESTVLHGKSLGVDAVVREFEALGDDEASECLQYVLYETAGTNPKLFENWDHPRDCDANGVLASRESMTLDDFVHHPHSLKAELTRAHGPPMRTMERALFEMVVWAHHHLVTVS